MSFASDIKLEILNFDLNNKKFIELLNGMLYTSCDNHLVLANKNLIQKFLLILIRYKIDYEIKYDKFKKVKFIFTNFKYLDFHQIKNYSYFFAGCFLSTGSISHLKSTSYHLELKFSNLENANIVKNLLNNKRFNFKLKTFGKKYILYLKKISEITDFLKAIRTLNSYFKLETEKISNEQYNYINRYSNLEVHNINKNVNSCLDFKKRFEYIINQKLEYKFNKIEIIFFKYKLNNLDFSLTELTKSFNQENNLNLTRSAYNHYLLKLKKITKF